MSAHFEVGLSCPACFQDLRLALVEDGADRRPRDGDHTVCNHCTAFLKYVEKVSLEGAQLDLAVVGRDTYEDLPERHQIALMKARNKLLAVRTRQSAIVDLLGRELVALKRRVDTMSCGCLYCNSGDGFNCARARALN